MQANGAKMAQRQNHTILVTGGAGYIGSHAARLLHDRGYRPVCYDNLSRGHRDAVRWGPLEQGDMLDIDRLDRVFAAHRPGSVMHFAALAYVGESVTDPLSYYRNNVAGTMNLLEVMRRHSVSRLVFSSTCAVYGSPEQLPIRESSPCRPVSPYGWSKYMVETILEHHAAAAGLHYISLRYFNAAGADPSGDLGERHDPETHLVPLVLEAAAGGRREIEVYGNDYDTPDGTCVRDYVHVNDIAAAHELALRRLEQGGKSGAYNVGTDHGFSVMEIIARSSTVTGRNIPFRITARRTGDPACLIADATRIRTDLGWSPQFSDLDNILKSAWNWHRQRS